MAIKYSSVKLLLNRSKRTKKFKLVTLGRKSIRKVFKWSTNELVGQDINSKACKY